MNGELVHQTRTLKAGRPVRSQLGAASHYEEACRKLILLNLPTCLLGLSDSRMTCHVAGLNIYKPVEEV